MKLSNHFQSDLFLVNHKVVPRGRIKDRASLEQLLNFVWSDLFFISHPHPPLSRRYATVKDETED